MRNRRVILILLLVVVVAALVAIFSREREPQYGGKSLGEWVEEAWPPGSFPFAQAQASVAIQNVGTNAVPYLLKWICYDTPPWKMRLYGKVNKLLSFLNLPLIVNHRLDRA